MRSWVAANPWAVKDCLILGICIFVVAFFLPACRDASTAVGSVGTLAGWQCAELSLSLVSGKDTFQSPFFLAFISGWINPLILLYLPFSLKPRFFKLRRILASAILICIAATWTFFAIAHFVPLIGHVLWIAGVLLILVAELSVPTQKPLV